MSGDLHTRLHVAIQEKLDLAKAVHDAEPGPWDIEAGKYFWIVDADGDRLAEVGAAKDAEFIAAHDPTWAIRQHEAALRVLERHVQSPAFTERPVCRACRRPGYMMLELWPCGVIRDLADAYGVSVDAEDADR